MKGLQFYEKEEAEDTFACDDSDVQEEERREYDEHFWCKDKDIPVGYTFKSKKQDFIKACESIKSNFKKDQKGAQKYMENLAFRILDSRNKENGPEMDIEISKNKERGNAVLKFYGPNSKSGECTLMITKSKRHDVKFVKFLANDIIKKMLDKFMSGEGWDTILTKTAIQDGKKQFVCPPCNKGFISEKNLNNHIEKFHTMKAYSCIKCEFTAKDAKQLKEHIRNHTINKAESCGISEYKTEDKSKAKEHKQEHSEGSNTCNISQIDKKDGNELNEHVSGHVGKENISDSCEIITEEETIQIAFTAHT